MKAAAQIVFGLAYVVIALFQWSAEIAGLRDVLGWPSFLCWVVAMFTAWVPLIGTSAGIWGAHAAWEWDWVPAISLFFGVPLFGVLCVGVLTLIEGAQNRKAGY